MTDASTRTLSPTTRLDGTAQMPPDKSIAQRAVLLAALAEGTSTIENFPSAADPRSLLACVRALGIAVEEPQPGTLVVHGRGRGGLRAPDAPLDCGNSGTAMRFLAGVLAGQPFDSTLVGDASLSARPMRRVTDPLAEMGARIETTDGHAPLRVSGGADLRGITYRLPVPSAQVKSCVLLAGLFARGETTVVETQRSRDHTERMLGLSAFETGGERHLSVEGGHAIPPQTWTVPGDFSAAAFFLVAASVTPGSDVRLPAVGLNPTRAALLDVLRAMGARIDVSRERRVGGEPVGDLRVRASKLHHVEVSGDLVPVLIDEVPVLAVAGTQAEGGVTIRDAAELRVKETDRIAATAQMLRAMGATVDTFDDGLHVEGPVRLRGAAVDSLGDHRIAMSAAVAALVAEGHTTLRGAGAADVSFPDFYPTLDGLRAG